MTQLGYRVITAKNINIQLFFVVTLLINCQARVGEKEGAQFHNNIKQLDTLSSDYVSLSIDWIKRVDKKQLNYIITHINLDTIDKYQSKWFEGEKFFYDDKNEVILYVYSEYPIIYFKKINYNKTIQSLNQFDCVDNFGYLKGGKLFLKFTSPTKERTIHYSLQFDKNKVTEHHKSQKWRYNEIKPNQLDSIHRKLSLHKIYIGHQDFYEKPVEKPEFKLRLRNILDSIKMEVPKSLDHNMFYVDLQLVIDKTGVVEQILSNRLLYDPVGFTKTFQSIRLESKAIIYNLNLQKKYEEKFNEMFLNTLPFFNPIRAHNSNIYVKGVYSEMINLGMLDNRTF